MKSKKFFYINLQLPRSKRTIPNREPRAIPKPMMEYVEYDDVCDDDDDEDYDDEE